jgi:molecular chaperone HtpG
MSEAADTVERHEFGAEVGRLLDLVVHSLYSDREIFLRELVANAADATDRRRFEALTKPALALPDTPSVRIVPDKAARQLLIADHGIGMTKQEMAQNLGTIARSGTRAFGQALADAKPDERPSLIGQFGVGFYSAFMVADRVEVTSRHAGESEAWTWASDGDGAYTLAPAERAEAGTDIVLHMKSDAEEFLEPMRLENVVRKWADHITIPITIARDGKDIAANEGNALWRRPKAEVSEMDANAFYRHLGNMFDTPWATIQWRAEGTVEFYAMLFVPGAKPFEPVEGERKSRVRLHVRRMFITDDAELLPSWLRFVQGVIDTEDLPLNVSREMLQATPVLGRLRRAATNRVLSELKSRAKEAGDYGSFWENFGAVLKEGVWDDSEHRAEIAPLLRFRSSHTPADQKAWVSLADYVGRLQEGQEAIWYLVGDDPAALAASPQLEGLRARGIEVLLLSDPIDSFWPERLDSFEGHKLRSVTQAAEELGAGTPGEDVSVLTAAIKEALGDRVSDVRATSRLTDSAVVLAAAAHGPDLQMQRLMRRSGRGFPGGAPILEVNPSHALVRDLLKRDKSVIATTAEALFDLACIQDGELPADPGGFARRMTALLSRGLAGG